MGTPYDQEQDKLIQGLVDDEKTDDAAELETRSTLDKLVDKITWELCVAALAGAGVAYVFEKMFT